MIPRRQIIPVERRYLDRNRFGVRIFVTKYGCHILEEPTENEFINPARELFMRTSTTAVIEETALVWNLFYPRYFDVRKLPIQRLPAISKV